MTMHSIAWWPSVGVLVAAAIIDSSTRRIPNWLSLPFLASGVLVHFATGGWAGCGRSFAGIGLAVLLYGLPCAMKLMGMGDLKLALGAGAWIGPGQFVFAYLFSGIVAGLIAAFSVLIHRPPASRVEDGGGIIRPAATARFRAGGQARLCDGRAHSIPYAPAFAVGTLFSFFGQ